MTLTLFTVRFLFRFLFFLAFLAFFTAGNGNIAMFEFFDDHLVSIQR